MGNFLVRYASRVVIYDRKVIIRLATGLWSTTESRICPTAKQISCTVSIVVAFHKHNILPLGHM